MATSRRKIVDRDGAVRWRSMQQGAVVFTNGVFDLVHPGHVEYLEAARALGDALILGVNSDASVQRLGKGPERPLVPLAARMRVLAGLAAVDRVVPFDEDTPLELITLLRPDVLVKGGDYGGKRIAGADVVEAYGGRIEIVPFVDGFSTTSLLERLRAQ